MLNLTIKIFEKRKKTPFSQNKKWAECWNIEFLLSIGKLSYWISCIYLFLLLQLELKSVPY